ncbi:MAG: urease accessory protein UreH domain-containing protein [Gemmatimonadaceae bacterium]
MSVWVLLATALALGAAHSVAPDHLAAIGVFVSRRPQWRRALVIGAGWGVGHSLVVAIVGGALVITGWRFPEHFAPTVERIVGITLIAIGVVALARAMRIHAHVHEHDGVPHWHLHSHRQTEQHDHMHRAALGMGVLHGLAGTGALVIALPLAATDSAPLALAYLAAFGLGTTVAMATFGAVAAWAVRRAAHRSRSVLRATASLAAIVSVAVGVWWTLAAG